MSFPAVQTVRQTIANHWPEYVMEAFGLGLFMISACVFSTWLSHPASAVPAALPNLFVRRILMGIAMGVTAVINIYSPWGQRSGAHLNPSVTLTFWRLGKVQAIDAVGYVLAQCAGATLGIGIAAVLLGPLVAHPSINYVLTRPGMCGALIAFIGEFVISCGMMALVLTVSSTPRIARLTGLFAGMLVVVYITLEAPLSGMSMNPARTLGSSVFARHWPTLWIYWVALPLGMLTAAWLYVRRYGIQRVLCAKLDHAPRVRCIFCGYLPAQVGGV